MNFEEEVKTICGNIADMLIAKNKAYGNSALEPLRVFSKADSLEQIKVRIDDKLSRLKHGKFEGVPEDTIGDLIGYLILLKIAGNQSIVGKVTKRKGLIWSHGGKYIPNLFEQTLIEAPEDTKDEDLVYKFKE